MFACTCCTIRYVLADVDSGRYFPSTGVCLSCYQKMYHDKNSCFGDEKLYDPSTSACGVECPDRKICKGFTRYRKEFVALT